MARVGPTQIRNAAAAATVIGMIATPPARRGGAVRRTLTTVVVAGCFATTTAAVMRRWGIGRAALAAGATVIGTAAVEAVGARTGRPFGRYGYTAGLRPQCAGVPVVVPLAWFAMAVPARETAHAALGSRSDVGTRLVAGAAALTAWDLFLDPQMVGEGYWRWARPGVYRGVPLSNFVGWFVTGLAVMAVLEVTVPPAEPATDLVAEYGAMSVMETVAFSAFFRDRVVAVVGGIATVPLALAGLLSAVTGESHRHRN